MNKSFRLDEQSRRLLASSLYAATSQQELCARARGSSIDFIEVSEESPALQIQSPPRSAWPLISAKNRRNHDIAFLNLRRFCPPEAAPETQ